MHSQRAQAALRSIARATGAMPVWTDAEHCQRYANDASEVPAQQPAAVLEPQDAKQMAAILSAASEQRVPVTLRGGGTSRVGGAVPSAGGLLVSCAGMSRRLDVDAPNRIAVLGPGVITQTLHAAAESERLFYPPDPNSWAACTVGGNVGTNAAGPRACKYGPTRDYVLGLQAVTGTGAVLQTGKRTLKGVVGYDLTSLLVGSEGTMAAVTEITVKLLPLPEAVHTLLAFLPDEDAVGRAVLAVTQGGLQPRCIELLDELALALVRHQAGVAIPDAARACLILELDGEAATLEHSLQRCGDVLLEAGALEVLVARQADERQRLWAARRALSHTMREQSAFKLSEDVVVPLAQLPELLRLCQALAQRHAIRMPTYGHAGDGNLHVNLLWDDAAQRPAVDAAIHELFTAVLTMGGTLSGEHGIGLLKAPYLALEQPPELIALQRQIKEIFDPQGILNPGKIFGASSGHGGC